MDKENLNILYTSEQKTIKFIGLFAIFITFYINIFIIDTQKAYYLVNIICSGMCFSIMLLSISTAKFTQKIFFELSGVAFFLIGFLNILHVIPIDYINKVVESINGENSFCLDFSSFSEVVYVLFAFDLMEEKIKNKNNVKKFIIANIVMMTVLLLMCKTNLDSNIINILFYVIIVLVSCYSIKKAYKFPLIKNNKVNYLYLFLIAITISNFLIVFIKIPIYIYEVSIVSHVFKLLAYFIFYFSMTEKLLNNPYNLLFNDLYLKNLQLNHINNKILEKNIELEQSQEYIKQQEKIFRELFDKVPLPLLIVSNKNNRVMYSNKVFVNLLKLNGLIEVINKNIFEIVEIDDILSPKVDFSKCSRNLYNGRTLVKDKYIDLEIQVFKDIEDAEDCILVFKDVSEEKKIENMKRDVEKKILEEKMRNDFLANITHDLKTPINVIYSAVQLENLLIEIDDVKNLEKYNFVNKDNCTTLIRLTNNLIDISKISYDYLKPQMKIYNIVELIEEFSNGLVEYMRGYDIDFIFDTEEEEIYVNCDREFMERIILNLLSNSIKHSSHGLIKVEIQCVKNKVNVLIEDDGTGMDEDFVRRAFDRYSMELKEEKNNYKGNGIGLYVVKNLVELQCGKIFIESYKNCGTIITLQFERVIKYV